MKSSAAVCLVLLLALAGCTGTPGADALGPDPTTDTPPAASAVELDGINETLRTLHNSRLKALGAYNATAALRGPNRTSTVREVVNGSARLTHREGTGATVARYTNATATYARVVEDGETAYHVTDPIRQFDPSRRLPLGATYERNGSATVDGTEVTRYEAVNASNASVPVRGEVESFEATLDVTDGNLVKRAVWTATTANGTVRFELRYDELGTATLERPTWVTEAAASGPDVPSVSFSFERDGSTVIVRHEGGDSIEKANLLARIDHDSGYRTTRWPEGSMTTGDTVRVSNVPDGRTIEIVWSAGGDQRTLATYDT